MKMISAVRCKATQLSGEQWYLGSEEIDAYAIIKFDADEGLKLSKDGFGAMVCTRN